jgi:heme/copper-type cytochrome/quinol oxidase subunit 3
MNANAAIESHGAARAWVSAASIRDLPIDQARGTVAMGWFIVSEAMVFLGLFFSYYYLGHDQPRWPIDDPPALGLPTAMVAVLCLSCIALWSGGWRLRRGRELSARIALLLTILLGCGFLVLNALDYRSQTMLSRPTENSYTSIFYLIEGIHAAHLILGLLFLLYTALLPRLGPTEKPPHGSYRNVAMYWYFVSAVWVVMYAVLFIGPHYVVGANPTLH